MIGYVAPPDVAQQGDVRARRRAAARPLRDRARLAREGGDRRLAAQACPTCRRRAAAEVIDRAPAPQADRRAAPHARRTLGAIAESRSVVDPATRRTRRSSRRSRDRNRELMQLAIDQRLDRRHGPDDRARPAREHREAGLGRLDRGRSRRRGRDAAQRGRRREARQDRRATSRPPRRPVRPHPRARARSKQSRGADRARQLDDRVPGQREMLEAEVRDPDRPGGRRRQGTRARRARASATSRPAIRRRTSRSARRSRRRSDIAGARARARAREGEDREPQRPARPTRGTS